MPVGEAMGEAVNGMGVGEAVDAVGEAIRVHEGCVARCTICVAILQRSSVWFVKIPVLMSILKWWTLGRLLFWLLGAGDRNGTHTEVHRMESTGKQWDATYWR